MAELHGGDFNVAKVDCTTEYGKSLCSDFEIRGYPTIYYLPAEPEYNGNFYKYESQRSLEGLEKFVLNGEFKHAANEAIPRQLAGLEYWQRQFELASKDVAREVDGAFEAYGYG